MPRSLYPNILFHFTGKEGLFGILSSTFRVPRCGRSHDLAPAAMEEEQISVLKSHDFIKIIK
jgi:hypothetical protein